MSALWDKSKPSQPCNRRHASVSTSLTSFVRTASVVFTLPVLPSVQSSMTCLCLETSLPMQRSHWHLMSRHFCLRLVSRNSTATAISMHCIVCPLKPRRTPQRGYNSNKMLLHVNLCGPVVSDICRFVIILTCLRTSDDLLMKSLKWTPRDVEITGEMKICLIKVNGMKISINNTSCWITCYPLSYWDKNRY